MKINRFNETGELLSTFSEDGDLIKDAELFTVGTHRGRNYTSKDLLTLVSSFVPEEQIPVQLDHSESVKDTVGYLEEVSVAGNKLMGKIRIIEETVKKRVAKGLAKKISISFYADEKGNPTKIREVSLVAFPQVKTAQLFAEESELVKLQEFADQLTKKVDELRDKMSSHTDFKAETDELVQVDEYNEYLYKQGLKARPREDTPFEREYQQYVASLGIK